MSSLYPRNGIYYIAYYDAAGNRRRVSTQTNVQSEATEQQLRIDAQYGSPTIKLSGLIEYYKLNRPAELSLATERKNLDALRRFLEITGDKQIRQLSRLDFERFKYQRLSAIPLADLSPDNSATPCRTPSPSLRGGLGRGLKPVSVNSELRALRSVFNYLTSLETIIERNPFRNIGFFPDTGDEASHLTPDDIKRLLTIITKPWLRDLIALAILTGMRPGELVALRPEQINLQNGTVTVRRTAGFTPKKGKVRTIPLHSSAKVIIERRLNSIDSKDSRNSLFPYSRSYVSHEVKKAMTKAGITGCNFRSLRHTFATLLLQQGVPIYNVSRLLGHASINLTNAVYSHFDTTNMQASINQLQAL